VIHIAATPAPTPPVARKVIYGALGYAVATVIQLVIPGYHPDPLIQQVIDGVVGTGAAFLAKEEVKYLIPALAKAQEVITPYEK
jgi:hypothetical protein